MEAPPHPEQTPPKNNTTTQRRKKAKKRGFASFANIQQANPQRGGEAGRRPLPELAGLVGDGPFEKDGPWIGAGNWGLGGVGYGYGSCGRCAAGGRCTAELVGAPAGSGKELLRNRVSANTLLAPQVKKFPTAKRPQAPC
jgi:hypothetical protein